MDAVFVYHGKIIALTLTVILFLKLVYKFVTSAGTKGNVYFLVIILILGLRICLLSFHRISYILLIALIYFSGKYHYCLNKVREVLIWRTVNITVMLLTLLSVFAGLFRHPFFFLLEILFVVFYAVFQIVFLFGKLTIQYNSLLLLLWMNKIGYILAAAYDILAYKLNFPVKDLVVWISVYLVFYLDFLMLFKENLLFPGSGWEKEQLHSAYSRITQTENMLLFQDKLVKVGVLATGILHELKNIFFTINTAVHLAKTRDNPASRREALEIILESTEKGKVFTETILKRIKLDESNKEKINLALEFNKLLAITKANYRSKGIRLAAETDAELCILAGKIDFEQIILNLISNSIAALHKVHNEDKVITLTARGKDDKVVIDIIDNGPGVPAEFEYTLFDPNISGSSSTGLGLYIADLLVKRNNGTLDYYPLDPGSDFRIIFEKPDPAE